MRRACLTALIYAVTIVGAEAAAQNVSWRVIQPGVEFASISSGNKASGESAGLYIVRVTPARAKLTVALASETKTGPRTAAEWCRTSGLAVAINAGMFQSDQLSNVGYLRHGKHYNNRRWNGYRTVLALNPLDSSLPRVLWIDREQSNPSQEVVRYDIVVQNLRLIARSRKSAWSQSEKRWSEAALATDSQGRLLFLFSRAPYSMHDFNDVLMKLPLDIAGAMHLEGGPEASLSIHVEGLDLDLAGSYETGFWPDDSNQRQWPIPNVLGVLRAK